jgi:hypothetical protein
MTPNPHARDRIGGSGGDVSLRLSRLAPPTKNG